MIDLRHHIYSLVAIFLALAVGMFIGKSFEAASPIEKQQSKIAHLNRILERMETDFATLRSEVVDQQGQIKEMESEIKRGDEYCHALLPAVIKGKLQWTNIAIIQTGDYGEDTTAVKTVLEQAGANVTSVTQFKNRQKFLEPAQTARIVKSCGLEEDGEPCRSLLRTIAGTVVNSQYYDKLVKMRDAGLVSLSGDYSRHNTCVIILGGGEDSDTSETIDALLIDEIKTLRSTVVGCEPVDVKKSFIPVYKQAGIASVDNVDKPFGQIGLVCALAGEVASFGVKETADRLMPQTLTGNKN